MAFSVRKHKSKWIVDQKRHISVSLLRSPRSSKEYIRASERRESHSLKDLTSLHTHRLHQNHLALVVSKHNIRPSCCLNSPSSQSLPLSPRLPRLSSELPLSSFIQPVIRLFASEFLPVPPLETERRYTTSLVLRLPPASRSPRVTTRS